MIGYGDEIEAKFERRCRFRAHVNPQRYGMSLRLPFAFRLSVIGVLRSIVLASIEMLVVGAGCSLYQCIKL